MKTGRPSCARLGLGGLLRLAACASPLAAPPRWSEQAGHLRHLPAVAAVDAATGRLVAPTADGHLAPGDHLEFDNALQRGARQRNWRLSVDVLGVETQDALDLRAHLPFEERVQPGPGRRARIEAEQRAFVERIRRGQAGIDEMFAPQAVAKLRVQAPGGRPGRRAGRGCGGRLRDRRAASGRRRAGGGGAVAGEPAGRGAGRGHASGGGR